MKRSGLCVATILALLVFATPAMGSFGLQRAEVSALNANGTPDVQAGSHPYELKTTFVLNEPERVNKEEFGLLNLKDVRAELPPGFVGDPNAVPRCTPAEFTKELGHREMPECPNDTVVGYANTYLS